MEPQRLSLPPRNEPGEVVTFHSHKGGAGRTMALANLALLLARREGGSRPVLMIDWDLEAPSLHHYFGVDADGPGVLELFAACDAQLQRGRRERNDADLAQAVLDAVGWEDYVVRADQARPLFLMRAGRQDASYAERLASLNWDRLFHSCPALFRTFAACTAHHFRHVLVDSPAGQGDVAGICTTLLPTRLVLVFTPGRQSLQGLDSLVQRATTYRRSHEDEQRPLLIYPLPTRIDAGDAAVRSLWRRGDPARNIPGYQQQFERSLAEAYGQSRLSLESYFDEVQLQQLGGLAYGEPLPVLSDEESDRFSLTRSFSAFLDWFEGGHCPWQSREEIPLLSAAAHARRALEEGAGRPASLALAAALLDLGRLYRRDGALSQAFTVLDESVALRRLLLGEDHPDTLHSKAALADVLFQQEKFQEARFLQEAVLAALEAAEGAGAGATLLASTALGVTLAELGQFPDALALQDTVIDAHERELGDDHPATIDALAVRADILARAGRLELALPLLERVLASRSRLLGTLHPDTERVRRGLAQLRGKLEQMPEQGRRDGVRHRILNVEQELGSYRGMAPAGSEHEREEEELSEPRIGAR
ncbi:KGGVGR-motif variant AAA ATPase [Massilia endophytica]|uniref:KGGVGR-motif variant AAA ATPase n=1 Tax=Massilia endophytica TaxID=2899220 RepID=UPI001E2A60E7|nr:tetratricopeptide repeat protein [Massilia endophytica]UGQ44895.1 tetratricopeptide repeat protein [Massilia endophytica]